MCGIFASTHRYSEEQIKERLSLIAFRGPDNSGHVQLADCILGHNRLAIIDLDERSNQPFRYMSVTVVFNGEIYNYRELRSELRKLGYKFTTGSDTEVLAALYIEYGEAALNMLNGMFAFVIHDFAKSVIFFARDRFGKKPLYYMISGGELEVASQVKQLAIEKDLEVDTSSVTAFFKYKYIPEPHSIYKNVKKLPAGYFGSFDLQRRSLHIESYWKLAVTEEYLDLDYCSASEKLEGLIKDAVEHRLISDVPVGVFLSGGIDSSLVAALAQDVSSVPIRTFNVKFEDKKFDESSHAQKIANHLGTDHTTIPCSMDSAAEEIVGFCEYFDEPFADSSAVPSLMLSRMARKFVTVALTGDGADETFLGYNRYDTLSRVAPLFLIPHVIRRLPAQLKFFGGFQRMDAYLSLLRQKTLSDFYHKLIQPMNQDYFSGNSADVLFQGTEYLETINTKGVAGAGLFDIKSYLSDDINVKIDRASMAHSLEARSPFLDYRVVEFGTSLPVVFRYCKSNKKRILKDIAYKYIPRTLLDRPKAGFTFPLGNLMKNELRSWVMDTLTAETLQSIPGINPGKTMRMVESHMSGVASRQNEIWKLMVYSMWMKSCRRNRK